MTIPKLDIPGHIGAAINFIIWILCVYLSLWILTWLLYWTAKYGFLPCP